MKAFRTTTIALVGAALLTLGALTGCSSDSDDKADNGSSAASDTSDDNAKDDDAKGDDSKDAADYSIDCDEYTTVFTTVDPPTNPGDMDAMADYYDALAAKSSGGMKNALEAMADAIRKPGDTAAAERAARATEAWSNAVMECMAG